MFKKLIGIVGASIMLLGVLVLTACDEMEEWILLDTNRCCNEFEQTKDYAENFAKSVIAYNEAITHFTTSDGKFTEDFGGVFVDGNGIHNICVVGNREPIRSDFLIYRQVNNSRNFLDSVVDEIGQVMQEYLVWAVKTCESCNSVIVCIESESKIPLLIAHLKISNLFSVGTMKFFVGENNIVLS